MADPVLHEQNRDSLQRMLGVPIRMKELPKELIEDVLRAQACAARINPGGYLGDSFLLGLAFKYEELPRATPTKFGHLKEGATMFFKINPYESVPCEFIRVADSLTHTYLVRLFGEVRPVGENMLSLEHPADVIQDQVPAATKKVAEDTEDSAETEAKRNEELKAARAVELTERLKEQWPVGRVVDVAIPGEEFFTGTILSHGTGRWAGMVHVRPSTETGNGYRRVPVSAISASELQPA